MLKLRELDKNRIGLHIAFWAFIWAFLTVFYGIKLPSFSISLRNNFFYLPIHIAYFYWIAYYLIPKFLLRKKYLGFVVTLCITVVVTALLSRLVRIFFIDNYLANLEKLYGNLGVWWAIKGTVWEQLTNYYGFSEAVKGTNFIVWFAVTIKLFKLWYERRDAALHAELNFLKGQVHPHFLFNTLNNLYSLTLKQSPKSPHIVMGLSEILRYMLYECNQDKIEVKRELEILESYIALEQLRFEERLDLSFSISGLITDEKVAPLFLMPLIENAFKHGAGEQIGQAWIKIDLSLNKQKLKFRVANSKTDVQKDIHHGNLGLENLSKRLKIIYPDAHQLIIDEDENTFLAILEINLDKHMII